MKQCRLIAFSLLLSGCGGKPSEVPDDFWEKYKIMGAPKILYQCGDQIGYSVGIGMNATYNKLVSDAKDGCSGTFKILDGKQ